MGCSFNKNESWLVGRHKSLQFYTDRQKDTGEAEILIERHMMKVLFRNYLHNQFTSYIECVEDLAWCLVQSKKT